jgi:hypothetical protein
MSDERADNCPIDHCENKAKKCVACNLALCEKHWEVNRKVMICKGGGFLCYNNIKKPV